MQPGMWVRALPVLDGANAWLFGYGGIATCETTAGLTDRVSSGLELQGRGGRPPRPPLMESAAVGPHRTLRHRRRPDGA